MIEHGRRWYHNMMLSFAGQVVIIIGCTVLIVLQFITYQIIEEDVVVFNDVCEVTIGPILDKGKETESVYRGATMMCGEDSRYLGALETPYLFEVLTKQRQPVIVCKKTVSEFLNDIDWSCKMDSTEKEI